MAKKKSEKKNSQKNEKPIYSKLNYNSSYNIKRNMLEMQEKLLKTIQIMKSYQELRKKEYVTKLKLRNNIKETKQLFKDFIEIVPETKGIKEKRKQIQKKHKEKPKLTEKPKKNVETQLQEIRKRLQELA